MQKDLEVFIIQALNSADFDEPEILGIGITEESARKWLNKCLKTRYDIMSIDDRDFYGRSLEQYIDTWSVNVWPFKVAEL